MEIRVRNSARARFLVLRGGIIGTITTMVTKDIMLLELYEDRTE